MKKEYKMSAQGAQELQDDLQNFEHENADEDAGDLTNAAVNRDAADGTASDGLKLPAVAGVNGAAAGLRADEEAGETIEQASGHVDQDLALGDVDARNLSSILKNGQDKPQRNEKPDELSYSITRGPAYFRRGGEQE